MKKKILAFVNLILVFSMILNCTADCFAVSGPVLGEDGIYRTPIRTEEEKAQIEEESRLRKRYNELTNEQNEEMGSEYFSDIFSKREWIGNIFASRRRCVDEETGYDYGQSFIDEYENIYGSSEVLCYCIDDEDVFDDFTENPTMEFLESTKTMPYDSVKVLEAMEVDFENDDDGLVFVSLNDDVYVMVYSDLFYLSPSFFKKDVFNVTYRENMQQMLAENGIDDAEITDIAVVYNEYYPIIVLVETTNGNYFWIYNGIDIETDEIEYEIYDTESFKNKAVKSYADVYVNGEKIDGDENAIMRWDYFDIKFRAFWTAMGAKNIEWDDGTRTASFYIDDNKYEYYEDGYKNVYYPENDEWSLTKYSVNGQFVDGCGALSWIDTINIDGSLYYPYSISSVTYRVFNKSVDVDSENKAVYFNDIAEEDTED